MRKIIIAIFILALCAVFFSVLGKRYRSNIPKEKIKNKSVFSTGDYDFSLDQDGLRRTYKVHVPPSYDEKSPIPAILNLHGGGGSAEGQINISQMNETADKKGFISIYPDGTGKKIVGKSFETWNSGTCCGSAKENSVDDVDFLSKVISDMESRFNIDKKRIFAAGYSNGAMMAMRLACEISDRIAAIATVASTQTISDCNLKHPVSMIHFHGTEDKCHLYSGGKCGGCFSEFFSSIGLPMEKTEYACESMASDINNWRNKNGCSEKSRVVLQKGNTKCIAYDKCSDNGEVEFCAMQKTGHVWPGGNSYAIGSCLENPNGRVCNQWKKFIGSENNDINANDMMWDFFQKHPMP